MAGYAGKPFVGIDLHRRRTVIVRTTESGEVLETVGIVNDVERRPSRLFLLLTSESSHLGLDPGQVEDPIDTLTQRGHGSTPALTQGSVPGSLDVVQTSIKLLYIG